MSAQKETSMARTVTIAAIAGTAVLAYVAVLAFGPWPF